MCSHFHEAVWHWAGNDIMNDWRVTMWDDLKCVHMYSLHYYHSSSNRSYVKIKLRCDSITSCANKKISIKPSTLCSVTAIFQSVNMSTFSRTWLAPVWDENCSNLDQEVWIQTLTKHPRDKHSIDILISSWVQSVILLEIFFLGHSLSNTVFLFRFLLLHAFLRTVEVFGPYLATVLSLTLCSDSSWFSPVSSACSCLTFVIFCQPSFNST